MRLKRSGRARRTNWKDNAPEADKERQGRIDAAQGER